MKTLIDFLFEEKRLVETIENLSNQILDLYEQIKKAESDFRANIKNKPNDVSIDIWNSVVNKYHNKTISSLNEDIENKEKEILILQNDLSLIRKGIKRYIADVL